MAEDDKRQHLLWKGKQVNFGKIPSNNFGKRPNARFPGFSIMCDEFRCVFLENCFFLFELRGWGARVKTDFKDCFYPSNWFTNWVVKGNKYQFNFHLLKIHCAKNTN